MLTYNPTRCSHRKYFIQLNSFNALIPFFQRHISSLTTFSNYSRSKFIQEIRKRYKREKKDKLPLNAIDQIITQVESIAAQRTLLSDKVRLAIIKGRLHTLNEKENLNNLREVNKKQILLPFDVKPRTDLFLHSQNEKHLFKDNQSDNEIKIIENDRGFFVSNDKYYDDYAAATTADLPETDMTEPPIKYFGDVGDAVESIEFQLPGQKSTPKKKSTSTLLKGECDEWTNNYGTTDVTEDELPKISLDDVKCAACGAQFHCHNSSLPGFIPLELLKQIERNLKKHPLQQRTDYTCRRCFLLKEYNFLLNLNVCDVDYVDMMNRLKLIQEALILLVVDMTDLQCSIYRELPKIIGSNKPMIIVGNKLDLLPPDAQTGYLRHYRDCLRQAVADAGISGNFNILKYLLISAKTGFGVEELITNIYQNWISSRGVLRNDIYVIGSTNAGKSTLFNAFIQSDLCKVRAMDLVERVTTSIWPGTTLSLLKFPLMNPTSQKLELRRRRLLSQQAWKKKEEFVRRSFYKKTKDPKHIVLQGFIGNTFKGIEEELQPISSSQLIRQFNGELSSSEIEQFEHDQRNNNMNLNDRTFQKGHWCFDTPGTVNKQQVLNLFTLEELINILPRSIIIPRIFILFPGQSLILGAVARIDIHSSSSRAREHIPIFLTVFASKNLKVNVMTTTLVDDFLSKHRGDPALGAPIGDFERLKQFPKLDSVDFTIKNNIQSSKCGVADIVLSSLGWTLVSTDAKLIKISAWTPLGRGLFLRQPPILPYAVNYKAQRIVGTSEYKIRMLSDIETFSSTQRSVRPKKIISRNIEVNSTFADEPEQFVNFDLA